MSWQGYIDNMMASEHVDGAMICGLDSSVWACSEYFKGMTKEEIDQLKQDNMSYLICGKKFLKLKRDVDQIQMKEVVGLDGVKRNVTVDKVTGQYNCLLVAVGSKDASGGNVATAVGKIKDYLTNLHV